MRLILTNGCFDGLHAGHVELFKYAKSLGNKLIVFVNNDTSIKELKGDKRPFFNEAHRLNVIESIRYVDHAFLFDGDVEKILLEYNPDIYVKGGDYRSIEDLRESDFIKTHNINVRFAPKIDDLSSSRLIDNFLKPILKK